MERDRAWIKQEILNQVMSLSSESSRREPIKLLEATGAEPVIPGEVQRLDRRTMLADEPT